jgi:hypothetical protein
MLIIPRIPFRRQRSKQPAQRAPGVALNLTKGVFFDAEPAVELTFDRAIDIASINPSAIQVNDDEITGNLFAGTSGATLANASTVHLPLTVIGVSEGGRVLLSATDASGIEAMDDGGTWAGVSDLELPFG